MVDATVFDGQVAGGEAGAGGEVGGDSLLGCGAVVEGVVGVGGGRSRSSGFAEG